jgi:aminopeptidase N
MLLDLETLDESRFFAMLRDYLDTFKGRRVTTADFRAIVEKHTGIDMGWFFDQWVYGTDLPRYKFSYKIADAPEKGYVVSIKIEQKDVSENFRMYVPVEIELETGERQFARVLVDRPIYEEELPVFPSRPKKLRLNPLNSVLARIE